LPQADRLGHPFDYVYPTWIVKDQDLKEVVRVRSILHDFMVAIESLNLGSH
jgi:hypothetical protein